MQPLRHLLPLLARSGAAGCSAGAGAPAAAATAAAAAAASSSSGRHLWTASGSAGACSSSGSAAATPSSSGRWASPAPAAFHSSARAAEPQPTPSTSAAAGDDAPAPSSSNSSNSGGGSGKKKAGKGDKGAPAVADAVDFSAQLAQLKSEYRRSRMAEFYRTILSRELLLKLNVRSVNELPRLERVDLAVQAKDAGGTAYVEKWQLLLHALGLEILTGTPAKFSSPRSRYYAQRNAVTGVKVSLAGDAAYDLLEKIAYLCLPAQNAFEGLLVRQLDRGGHLHFKISSMVNFPDYEEMFETFENLGALDVNLVLSGAAKKPGRSRVLLTGLQLPVLARKHQVGGEAPPGGEGGGGGGGGESE